MSKKNKIMVIYGGISAEREISIISSREIISSLRRLNYDVVKIDANLDLIDQIYANNTDIIFKMARFRKFLKSLKCHILIQV